MLKAGIDSADITCNRCLNGLLLNKFEVAYPMKPKGNTLAWQQRTNNFLYYCVMLALVEWQ